MAYISGNTSESGRIIIINEDTWSLEKSRLIDSGNYRINALDDGKKTVICRRDDGKSDGFGNVDTAIENYQVFSCGSNDAGQLGLNDIVNRSTLTQIGTEGNWKSVVCGYWNTLAIKTDGTLWGCGFNWSGQLGLGNISYRSTLTQVGTATDWKSVSCGDRFTLAIKTNGTLWSCGLNDTGQLGLNDRINRSTLTQIGSDTDWKDASCGNLNLFAIKENGTLWGCGNNSLGQLGLNISGVTAHRSTLTKIGTDTNWKSASGGGYHTLAIKTDGTLWSWGNNWNGELGHNNIIRMSIPTKVGTDTDWEFISAGFRHNLALKNNGTLWSWGNNWHSQLGHNDIINRSIPTKVGTDTDWEFISTNKQIDTMEDYFVFFSLTIKNNGTVYGCGLNTSGQFGLGDLVSRSIFTQIGSGTDWESVSCGGAHIMFLK